jgi:hypothetical protein
MQVCILALSSSGPTFLGIDLLCKLTALIPRPGIDLGFRFILVRVLMCMGPASLYFLAYNGEAKGIYRFYSFSFQSRKQWVKGRF